MRLKLPFAFAAIFVLTGLLIDSSYQRSTPEAVYVQGTDSNLPMQTGACTASSIRPNRQLSDLRQAMLFPSRTRGSTRNGRELTRFGSTIAG